MVTENGNGWCVSAGINGFPDSRPGSSQSESEVGGTAQRVQPFIIGVAGGSSCGKSTVCDRIIQRLHDQCVAVIRQENFYRDLSSEQLVDRKVYNFDHPDAIDDDDFTDCIRGFQAMKPVEVPQFNFESCKRLQERKRMQAADVVIVEGCLVLHCQRVRELLDMKIFVDTDDDVRLARRIQRDVSARGRDIAEVLGQYTQHVKPSYDTFVAPSRKFADIIIPWSSGDNLVAIDLITEHIRSKLREHGLKRFFFNLEVIPSNFQMRGMHTIVRDKSTSKSDFVFYADRLIRLVVEAGLGHLPFTETTVTTPTGHQYVGVEFAQKLCGVSIIRSGESMENALRDCCKGIKIGKILIHREKILARSASKQGPLSLNCETLLASEIVDDEEGRDVVYERLPKDIADRFVLLLDPVLSTGHSACKAIEVLLAKKVQESKILFLTLIASPDGVRRVCSRFPSIKVITSEIDEGIDAGFCVVPGVGEFADRYFCD